MFNGLCYIIAGSAFIALSYLVPKWFREQLWLIKQYPKLLWNSLTKRD